MIPAFQLTEEAVHQQYRQQQIDAQHAQQAQLRAQAGHLHGESDQNFSFVGPQNVGSAILLFL